MKLLLRRDQKTSLMNKVVFTLSVRAELSEEEKANIRKYKLEDTMLYERDQLADRGSGLIGAASRLVFKMNNLSLSVSDLERGKQIDCKNVVEMLGVEDLIKEAAHTFKAILAAASQFGGEEVIEIK